uniref:Bactericidal permeability-increasing protein n=1 Tax=Amphilophus citrinellus TaxID=61819 RepID=A0A3Q0SZU1_AMPCI
MLQSGIVVLILLSCTYGENPAVQVVLTDKGLQYGKHAATDWIQERLEMITFPDISGDVDILIGTVDYTLTGITIKKCDIPEPSVEFLQDVPGFKASISGLCVALTGEWRTQFGIIHDGGTFDMAILNIDLTSVVQLGKEDDGHLTVTSVSCDAQVGDVDIHFYGGGSFFFNPFVSHFKGKIIDEIQKRLCPGVEENINSVESHLHAMNVSFDVNEVLTLDLPLTAVPMIGASSMNLGLKGEFYNIKTHKEPPYEAQPFTMPDAPSYMLSVGMSDFTLNTASYGYYSDNLLQLLVNDSMIPSISPVRLNTTSMGKYIPQLAKMYPDMLMNVLVYARDAPMVSTQPDAVKVIIKAAAKASAIHPNGTQIPLFTLNAVSSLDSENSLMSAFCPSFPDMCFSVAEKLGAGFVVLRMKYAELVNSVLSMEEVSICKRTHIRTNVWLFG